MVEEGINSEELGFNGAVDDWVGRVVVREDGTFERDLVDNNISELGDDLIIGVLTGDITEDEDDEGPGLEIKGDAATD